jgi:hypothetical protein
LYAIDQAAAGIFLSISWVYASQNHRLVDKNLKASTIHYGTIRNVVAPIFFVGSMGIALVNPFAASFFWLGMFPVLAIAHRLERRK